MKMLNTKNEKKRKKNRFIVKVWIWLHSFLDIFLFHLFLSLSRSFRFVCVRACVCVSLYALSFGHDKCLRAFIMVFKYTGSEWIRTNIHTHKTHTHAMLEIKQIKRCVKYTQWLIKKNSWHLFFLCWPHSSRCAFYAHKNCSSKEKEKKTKRAREREI